jgi:hypothetical protein
MLNCRSLSNILTIVFIISSAGLAQNSTGAEARFDFSPSPWVQDLYGDHGIHSFTVDLGIASSDIVSVSLELIGRSEYSIMDCIPPEDWTHVPDSQFGIGFIVSAGLTSNETSLQFTEYPPSGEFSISGPIRIWPDIPSEFMADGTATFSMHYWPNSNDQPDWCHENEGNYFLNTIGMLEFDSATLVVVFETALPNEMTTWGMLKAIYR